MATDRWEDAASMKHDELQKAFAQYSYGEGLGRNFNFTDIINGGDFSAVTGCQQSIWYNFGALKHHFLIEEPLDDKFNVPDMLAYFTDEGDAFDDAVNGVVAIEIKTDMNGQFGGTMRKLKKYARGSWRGHKVEGVILIASDWQDTRKLFCREGFLTLSAQTLAGAFLWDLTEEEARKTRLWKLYAQEYDTAWDRRGNPIKTADIFPHAEREACCQEYDLRYCYAAVTRKIREDQA